MDQTNPSVPPELSQKGNEVNFTPIEAQRSRQNFEALQPLWRVVSSLGSAGEYAGPAEAMRTFESRPASAENPRYAPADPTHGDLTSA